MVGRLRTKSLPERFRAYPSYGIFCVDVLNLWTNKISLFVLQSSVDLQPEAVVAV